MYKIILTIEPKAVALEFSNTLPVPANSLVVTLEVMNSNAPGIKIKKGSALSAKAAPYPKGITT